MSDVVDNTKLGSAPLEGAKLAGLQVEGLQVESAKLEKPEGVKPAESRSDSGKTSVGNGQTSGSSGNGKSFDAEAFAKNLARALESSGQCRASGDPVRLPRDQWPWQALAGYEMFPQLCLAVFGRSSPVLETGAN